MIKNLIKKIIFQKNYTTNQPANQITNQATYQIVHIISNMGHGGAEKLLYELLQQWNPKKFKHTVIYFHDGIYVEKIKKLGIPVYKNSGLVSKYDPIAFFRLTKKIRSLGPDCLHTSLWAANFFGRLISFYTQIPHIEVLHNNIDQNGYFRNFLDRLTVYKNNTLIAVSNGVAQSVQQYAPWLLKQTKKIIVIQNGIPIKANPITTHTPKSINMGPKQSTQTKKQDTKEITRESLKLTNNNFIIGSVGRLEPVKNFSLLLSSFALLQEKTAAQHARLILVGSGSQEQLLKTQAHKLGIENKIIFIVGQDAQAYYRLFDCFVLTSPKEGISLALLEAMSLGIPPIITCIEQNAPHDVLINKLNGLLIRSQDPYQLANSLHMLIQDKLLYKKLKEAAPITISQKFNINKTAQNYSLVYTMLIEKKKLKNNAR